MKNIMRIMAQTVLSAAMMLTPVTPAATLAATPAEVIRDGACLASPDQAACQRDTQGAGLTGLFKKVIETLIFLVAAVSVFMIVLGGLRYVLSGGDPAGIKNAKDTILYSIVGLIVATAAFAIVRFVVGRL
jgi:hypothetical protein